MTAQALATRTHNRASIAIGSALVAIMTAVPALAGQETHSIHTEVLNPAFGTKTPVEYALPRFNDQGGSLTLDSVEVDYSLMIEFTIDMFGNTTDEVVSNVVNFSYNWSGVPFPHDVTLESGNVFVQYDAMPHEEPGMHTSTGNGVTYNDKLITDPVVLTSLTGNTPMTGQGIFELTTATDGPPIFGGGTWDPDLFDLLIDRLYVDMDVTYNYSTIPTPGALAVAALGLPVFTRRRRRRS